jgi:Flp pilus assembly protein TadB
MMTIMPLYEKLERSATMGGTNFASRFLGKDGKCLDLKMFWVIPLWILWICLAIFIGLLAVVILLTPFYVVTFFVLLRMVYWWSKDKRVKGGTEKN